MKVIGHGSVVQRGKSKSRSRCRDWELSVLVEADGRRRRRTRAFHGTYTQAQDALSEYVDELRGTPVTSGMPFSAYMDSWFGRRAASGAVSARTLRTDREKLAPVRGMLGDRPISSVTPDDVRAVYEGAMAGKTPSGRKWSPQTVLRMHTALSKMLSDAVSDGIIASSPAAKVDVPRQRADTSGQAMPADLMDAVLASLDWSLAPHRAVGLALGCGLRRSECCALDWSDVRDGCVRVSRACEDDGSPKPTKTGRTRTVPAPPVVLAGLESARSEGRVVDMLPHSVTRWWIRHRAGLGCGRYRFHDLRHSYATRLAASGVHMRVAMELCGWSSVEMAARVYTHVSDELQRDAVRAAFA